MTAGWGPLRNCIIFKSAYSLKWCSEANDGKNGISLAVDEREKQESFI
jgi:hypothetical protein